MNRILMLATFVAMCFVPFAQSADAGIFNRINRLRGRHFSDGYHVCSRPLYAPYELMEKSKKIHPKQNIKMTQPKSVVPKNKQPKSPADRKAVPKKK